jgi:hypothetical protein
MCIACGNVQVGPGLDLLMRKGYELNVNTSRLYVSIRRINIMIEENVLLL